MEVGTRELVKWIIRSDRRLMTIRSFKHRQFISVSGIAQQTGRSIQNISTALKELEEKGVVDQLEPGRRTWKKYGLTYQGKSLLELVERELSMGMFEKMADELSFRYVRDAYRLVVTDPIIVTKEMNLHAVVDKVLADPRTRSAYVVDGKRRVIGMISLKQMLKAIEGSLSLVDRAKGVARQKRATLPFSVEEYMIKPITVTEDDRLLGSLDKMIEHGLEDLPVVDEGGSLVGELNGFEILLLGSDVMKRQGRV